MGIAFPSKQQLIQWFLDSHKTFFPNEDRSEGSDAWREAQGVSSIGYALVARLKAIYMAMFPTTATGADLDIHAEVHMPSDKRRLAASGTSDGDVRVYGTPTSIPLGARMVSADGLVYQTIEDKSASDWIPGPPGQVVVKVASISKGRACNKPYGTQLTWVSPISGVQDPTVNVDLSGARDAETDDELRARLLSRLKYIPGGGNWAHYMHAAQGVGNCEKAYVYPLFNGLGTVHVVCLGLGRSEDYPIGDRFGANETLVRAYIEETMLPATVAELDVSDPIPQAEDVKITILPAPGYEPDWMGNLTAYNMPDTSTVKCTTDPTLSNLAVDDRILLNVRNGSWFEPCVRKVKDIKGAPDNTIEVYEAFPSTAPDTEPNGVLPAGPATQEQANAILALFDGLTPGDASIGDGRRPVPGPEHPTDLYVSSIYGAIHGLPSVLNMVVDAPAASVAPTGPKYLIRNGTVRVAYP